MSRLENDPTVPSTVPAAFSTCALKVSGLAVVVLSVLSTCSQ
ncbi:hypothetical protein ACFQ9X_07310 [Catenulispora yoronensis]